MSDYRTFDYLKVIIEDIDPDTECVENEDGTVTLINESTGKIEHFEIHGTHETSFKLHKLE